MIIMILGILVFLYITWVIYDHYKIRPIDDLEVESVEAPKKKPKVKEKFVEEKKKEIISKDPEKAEEPKFYIDERGYERDEEGVLIHRKVAWQYLYDISEHTKNFREYDVHHKDMNKRNNHKDNLQILTREEHKKEHGQK